MRLRSPLLALLGLIALGAVSLQLLSGSLGLGPAALRVAVAVGVLAVVDRIGVPVARALVGPAAVDDDQESPPQSD